MSEPISTDALLGHTLAGNYTVLRILGDGGLGTVYLARNEALQCNVAVKVLKSSWITDPKHIKRLAAEANALATLSHPNIVKVLSVNFDDPYKPFMVMENVEGRTLRQIVESDGPLNAEQLKSILVQTTEALKHAHSKGIIHRDLKPENLMLTDSGHLKILDFGLAKMLGVDEQRLTKTGEILGSPLFISPEQCNGGTIDQRTDIYSIGCCMYYALTGKPPFRGDTILEVLFKQLNEAPTLDSLPDMPLSRVALKCMEKEPADRIQSAQELQELLCNSDSLASPRHRLTGPITRKTRSPVKILALAAIALISVSCAVMAFLTATNATTTPEKKTNPEDLTLNELLERVRHDIGEKTVTEETEKYVELACRKTTNGAELSLDVEGWATRTYDERGKPAEALKHSERYISKCRKLGKYWSDTSMSHAYRLRALERYDDAIAYLKKDIRDFSSHQGRTAVRTLQFDLAELYRDIGRTADEAAINAQLLKVADVRQADQDMLDSAAKYASDGMDTSFGTAAQYLKTEYTKKFPALRMQACNILGNFKLNHQPADPKEAEIHFRQGLEEYRLAARAKLNADERARCNAIVESTRQNLAAALKAQAAKATNTADQSATTSAAR